MVPRFIKDQFAPFIEDLPKWGMMIVGGAVIIAIGYLCFLIADKFPVILCLPPKTGQLIKVVVN